MSKNNSGEGNPNYGKTRTESTKIKIREKNIGKKQAEETKIKRGKALRKSWLKRRFKESSNLVINIKYTSN